MRKEESGRSLIEIIGVLAIGAIMIASAYSIYKSIDNRQTRLIATETLKDVATKTKTLYEFSGYENVSVAQLQTDGVMSNTDTPIGGSWEIKGIKDDNEYSKFQIEIKKLNYDDCNYLAVKKTDWAIGKKVNGSNNGNCLTNPVNNQNTITFIVK